MVLLVPGCHCACAEPQLGVDKVEVGQALSLI
jgi:hypothetical protein